MRHPANLAFLLAFVALGCSRSGVERQRLPDGSFQFNCERELWKCLVHVDDVCKGGSYEVLHAHDEHQVYGSTESQVQAHRSRALVRCLRPGQRPLEPDAGAVPAPPKTAPSAPLRTRACVPGSTQSCVGSAACAGGQACLADGSGFGRCDCGSASVPGAPAAAPSAAPAVP